MSLLILLLALGSALAAQAQLRLESQDLVQGQTVTARLLVIDGRARGVPALPAGEGLQVEFQGQSSEFSWVNGRSTRVTAYVYAVAAVQPGTWSLGPTEVEVGGETIAVEGIRLTVGERDAGLSEAGVSAELSDDSPFLGQTVVYRMQYRHTERLLDARWTPPDYDGFVTERSAEAAERSYTVEVDGQTVGVKEIHVPLVAVGEGSRTIGPSTFVGVFADQRRSSGSRGRRDLFEDFGLTRNVREDRAVAGSIPLEVRPLPVEGKPANFSGLVGRFGLRAVPSATRVGVGESVTLTIELAGDGTLVGLELPPAPEDAGFRAYDDAPELVAQVRDGEFIAKATFRRALVPEAEGELVVPPVELVVFDPEDEVYVTVRSEPVVLQVGPGSDEAGEVSSFSEGGARQGEEVGARGDDILPAPGEATLGDATLRGSLVPAAALVALPGLAWGGLLLGGMTRREDPWRALGRRLDALPADPGARLGELEAVFREAAALRLGRPAPGLDEAAVAELGEEALALYRDLGAARYGGLEGSELDARVRAFVQAGPGGAA